MRKDDLREPCAAWGCVTVFVLGEGRFVVLSEDVGRPVRPRWLCSAHAAGRSMEEQFEIVREGLRTVDIECFWCDPLPVGEVLLRRYHRSRHDARVVIAEIPLPLDRDGDSVVEQGIQKSDPRWPQTCLGCDYRFVDDDGRAIFVERKFQYPGTGEIFAANSLPIGAMSWVPLRVGATCGGQVVQVTDGDGDGRCLFVVISRCPDPSGAWHGSVSTRVRWEIDGLTAGSDLRDHLPRTWRRRGTPPRITVEPEICCPLGFVGAIRDGRLQGWLEESW